jgi:DNA topoisomerase-6 subunit B
MTSMAEQLAKKQKEISVSEFFERNRQILGFDSPTKALLMAIKEAVDNPWTPAKRQGSSLIS